MKSLIRLLLVPWLLLTGFVCVCAQNGAITRITETKVIGGVTTLYALDPLAQSFCFRDADTGLVFTQHQVTNRCSDINYNSYYAEQFAVGIEGGRLGAIVDLGTGSDLNKEYGYQETVGGGQGFASVHREAGRVVILKDRRAQLMQDLKEAGQLFTQAAPDAKAAVKIGHVYLARITDRDDKNFEVLVKLLVIGYVPGESVTFRWQAL